MDRKTGNAVLVGAGIASVVAFFMPFLDLGGIATASGWEILVAEHAPWTYRLAMLALPLGGLALIAAGGAGRKKARLVGFGFGAGVYGYFGYQMVKIFFATTGVGLWILLAAAGAALFAALASKKS